MFLTWAADRGAVTDCTIVGILETFLDLRIVYRVGFVVSEPPGALREVLLLVEVYKISEHIGTGLRVAKDPSCYNEHLTGTTL